MEARMEQMGKTHLEMRGKGKEPRRVNLERAARHCTLEAGRLPPAQRRHIMAAREAAETLKAATLWLALRIPAEAAREAERVRIRYKLLMAAAEL
ncbi:MAG: hypothetical protein SOY94_02020 [Candidatus Limiplasma sp.]|nr:hypothetical protein [Candidatus Limiplasma sp.]